MKAIHRHIKYQYNQYLEELEKLKGAEELTGFVFVSLYIPLRVSFFVSGGCCHEHLSRRKWAAVWWVHAQEMDFTKSRQTDRQTDRLPFAPAPGVLVLPAVLFLIERVIISCAHLRESEVLTACLVSFRRRGLCFWTQRCADPPRRVDKRWVWSSRFLRKVSFTERDLCLDWNFLLIVLRGSM